METHPLHFTIPPSPSSTEQCQSETERSSATCAREAFFTTPIVIGHLTHAHEATLNYAHPPNYERFYTHETERLASWMTPNEPKAANLIPALMGEWACAPLEAPRPRDRVRGGGASGQQHPPPGEFTRDWETVGAIFWHTETVGGRFADAARLIWQMEDANALPLCNEATEETRDTIRFLGRYDINDYGNELSANQNFAMDDPNKAAIGYDEDSYTHSDILLGSEKSPVSLGAVCYFCTVEAYWDHFKDISASRDELNHGDDEQINVDEFAFADGINILSDTGGAVAIARNLDRMHLRAFLHQTEGRTRPAVKAFIFYGASDDDYFSLWRVGDNSGLVIPGKGLPPGGFLDRNDQVDDLYGIRPFDHVATETFFESMGEDEEVSEWWCSLPRPVARRFVFRLIRGCFISLWKRVERVSSSCEGRHLSSFLDESSVTAASNVPELNPNISYQTLAFQNSRAFSTEARSEMVARVLDLLNRDMK